MYVFMNGKLINNLYKDINKEFEVLADWFHANKLSKTKHMLTVVTMSDKIIKPTHCIIFIGLYIDERLDWQEHINACRKISCFICNKQSGPLSSSCFPKNNLLHFNLSLLDIRNIYVGIYISSPHYKIAYHKKSFVLFFKKASMNSVIPSIHTYI